MVYSSKQHLIPLLPVGHSVCAQRELPRDRNLQLSPLTFRPPVTLHQAEACLSSDL